MLRPYIKLHLYPYKAAKKKTQPIESGTDLNPVFNGNFKFRVSPSTHVRAQSTRLMLRAWRKTCLSIVRLKCPYGTTRKPQARTFSAASEWTWAVASIRARRATGWTLVTRSCTFGRKCSRTQATASKTHYLSVKGDKRWLSCIWLLSFLVCCQEKLL